MTSRPRAGGRSPMSMWRSNPNVNRSEVALSSHMRFHYPAGTFIPRVVHTFYHVVQKLYHVFTVVQHFAPTCFNLSAVQNAAPRFCRGAKGEPRFGICWDTEHPNNDMLVTYPLWLILDDGLKYVPGLYLSRKTFKHDHIAIRVYPTFIDKGSILFHFSTPCGSTSSREMAVSEIPSHRNLIYNIISHLPLIFSR